MHTGQESKWVIEYVRIFQTINIDEIKIATIISTIPPQTDAIFPVRWEKCKGWIEFGG